MAQSVTKQDIVDLLREFGVRLDKVERALRDQVSVHGCVASDGSVEHGNDSFSSVRNGAGDYTVTFNDPFDALPVIVLGAGDEVVGPIGVRLDPATPHSAGGFRVMTFDTTNGDRADSEFAFIATHS